METVSNYTIGTRVRRVDLYVMGPLDFASSESQLTAQTMGADIGGRVCAGIVKVAQKVVVTMLANNVVNDSSWGTSLGSLLLSGKLGTIKSELGAVLEAGVKYTQSSLIAEEDVNLPDDERISELTLLTWDMDVYNSLLNVSVSVSTRNYETLPIIVPIPIVP